MAILGIGDASEYDTFPSTDWQKAADMDCKFVLLRATTTSFDYKLNKPFSREDTRHFANAQAISISGIDRWSYCWFDPRPAITAWEQAQFFISAVNHASGPGNQHNLVALDIEPSDSINYDAAGLVRARAWLDIVSQAGFKPAIYTYPSFIEKWNKSDISWMSKYYLIIAHWDVIVPRCPFPWYPGGQLAWQYTAGMNGDLYGFHAAVPGKTAPRICMAVM
jgi:GH25 family lysozyme M1 (1,4-beta-N-acetylmuramidase)